MKTTTLCTALVAAALSPFVTATILTDSDWQALLGAADLDVREAHFDELVRAARDDAELRAEIAAWAEGQDELAWTARLAQRELEREPTTPFGRGRLMDPFGDDFPFGGDDFGHAFGFGGGSPFGADVDELFEQLRSRSGSWSLQPPIGGGQSSGQSFSLQQTPDGVRIEITTEEDGEAQTQTYEGDSLEDLFEAHPELREHVQGGAFSEGALPFGLGRPFTHDFRAPRRGFGFVPRTPRNDVLGVRVAAPEDGEAGLMIHQVVPGSIAAALGLEAGERLIELDGRAIESVDDVANALSERKKDATVTARVLAANGTEREATWTPSAGQAWQPRNPFRTDGTRKL